MKLFEVTWHDGGCLRRARVEGCDILQALYDAASHGAYAHNILKIEEVGRDV